MRIIEAASGILVIALALGSTQAWAEAPLARCVLIDEETVRCKGLFGDGSDAAGMIMDVIAVDGRLLIAGKLDRHSTLQFARPREPFHVLFDIGPGMQVTIEQEEIQPIPRRSAAFWMRTR